MTEDAALSGLEPPLGGRPPLRRTAREAIAFLTPSPALSVDGLLPGDGRTLLLLPGWFRGDGHTLGLRTALTKLGYNALGWDLGVNFGPTRHLMDGAMDQLTKLADAHGPISLIGFSMGGLFVRWLSRTRPDCVREVITVGSPIRDPMHSFWLPIAPFASAWRGVDLAKLLDQVSGPLRVPVTALFTPDDGLVDPAACYDVFAGKDNNLAFRGGHVVMASNQEVLTILAQRLGSQA